MKMSHEMPRLATHRRLLALCVAPALALAFGAAANAATAPQSVSMSMSIVIPPHCMEVLGADEALESGLRERRLLCKQKTGLGKPVRIELGESARYAQGEANVVHRGGFD